MAGRDKMLNCTFLLNAKPMSTLCCPGTGYFPAYSGLAGVYRNNPQTIDKVKKGALPVGKYYIVSRPNGGWGSAVRDRLASWGSGSDRDLWFALFKDDGVIDDVTFINTVQRGSFRLHPAGYQGISEGCITLPSSSDFAILRDALLSTETFNLTPLLTAFGTIHVY